MDEADRYCDRLQLSKKRNPCWYTITAEKHDLWWCNFSEISGFIRISLPGSDCPNGRRLPYLSSKIGSQAHPSIKYELTAQGMQVLEMSVRSPSLDDVFLHLVGPGEDTSPFKLSAFRNMTGKRKWIQYMSIANVTWFGGTGQSGDLFRRWWSRLPGWYLSVLLSRLPLLIIILIL